ncbi:MAG: hypothetical protein ACP5UV_00520 [Thermoplasmata archaeon]
MKNWSGHIYFEDKFEWSKLDKVFPEIYNLLVDQKKNPEDQQFDQVMLQLNLEEIKKNKKPLGYLKEDAKYHIIFPLDRKSIIIYRGILSDDIRNMTEEVVKMLRNRKIKLDVDYDKMILYELRKMKK